jgi:hypothetical protein
MIASKGNAGAQNGTKVPVHLLKDVLTGTVPNYPDHTNTHHVRLFTDEYAAQQLSPASGQKALPLPEGYQQKRKVERTGIRKGALIATAIVAGTLMVFGVFGSKQPMVEKHIKSPTSTTEQQAGKQPSLEALINDTLKQGGQAPIKLQAPKPKLNWKDTPLEQIAADKKFMKSVFAGMDKFMSNRNPDANMVELQNAARKAGIFNPDSPNFAAVSLELIRKYYATDWANTPTLFRELAILEIQHSLEGEMSSAALAQGKAF